MQSILVSPSGSPLLLAAGRPLHQIIRAMRNRHGREMRSFRSKMEQRQEVRYKTLEESAASKGLPVAHFATDVFEPVDRYEDMLAKHEPFFTKMDHRISTPYYRDSSLQSAQINKKIYRTLRTNKSADIWKGVQEEKRARRYIPIPISMTGLGLDHGSNPKYWTVKIRNLVEKLGQQLPDEKRDNLLHNVTPGVRMMLEAESEEGGGSHLSRDHQELQRFYRDAKAQLTTTKKDDVEAPVVFPHSLATRIREELDQEIALVQQQDKELLDQEYSEYMKHRKVLSYIMEGMREQSQMIEADEADSEIEAWRDSFWRRSYGTPDPSVPASKIPCGGCGALMHCNDPGIPGYLPSEKFKGMTKKEKQREVCQRCEFLNHFNVSIDVTVGPDEYPAIISKIRECRGIVILMVDLLDFPCSIWPDAMHLIGEKRKVYVVGNKVDLLPQDGKGFLDRITESLKKCLPHAGVDASKDIHVKGIHLISAKTGYGVESLITTIYKNWNGRDDIYLVGCTNVGKSTLFNALLQSDICGLRQHDLIQRATTSLWPGTTLSLLKFPINRMKGMDKYKRELRLRYIERVKAEEYELRRTLYRQTGHHVVPQILDRIGMTFRQDVPFTVDSGHPLTQKPALPVPFEEHSDTYKDSRYLYDTPGTVYKDQLLSQLTTEELLKTVPRELITPRTFSLQPFQTLFIAGLARLDVIHSRQNVLLTVFASRYLPIHVVYTQEAARFYNLFLGTELLAVPTGSQERLKVFPPLIPKEVDLKGVNWKESCADIVLSSAGWVSVTMGEAEECVLKTYTPDGRGIFVRRPAMLPFAVNMRGRRIFNTPCFETKVLTINDFDEEKDPGNRKLFDYWEERNFKNSYKSFRMRSFEEHGKGHNYGWHEVDPNDIERPQK